jgi:hypothetical protein
MVRGRLLIHPLLRKSAGVMGDVAVMGYLTYLEGLGARCFQGTHARGSLHRRGRGGDCQIRDLKVMSDE